MATLCQYNITGLCCVCITAGCLQATSVCGTHYGDGANLTGTPTAVSGQVVYMPAATTTPSGYLPADGSVYPKASYANLGTCYCNLTFGGVTPLSGTNIQGSWVDFIESLPKFGCVWCSPTSGFCTLADNLCCKMLSKEIFGQYDSIAHMLNCCCIYAMALCDVLRSAHTAYASSYVCIQHVGNSESWFPIRNMTDQGITFLNLMYTGAAGYCTNQVLFRTPSTDTNSTLCMFDPIKRCCYVASMLTACNTPTGNPFYGCVYCQFGYGFGGTVSVNPVCNFLVLVQQEKGTCLTTKTTVINTCCATTCLSCLWDKNCGANYYLNTNGGQGSWEDNYGCFIFGITESNFLCNVVACGNDPLIGTFEIRARCSLGVAPYCDEHALFYNYGGDTSGATCGACCLSLRCIRIGAVASLPANFTTSCCCIGARCGHTSVNFFLCGQCSPALAHIGVCIAPCWMGNQCRLWKSYAVGYDRAVSIGVSGCIGVFVVAAGCTITGTCYPCTCVNGFNPPLLYMCYSNPGNVFVGWDCTGDIWTSPGNSGFVWTKRICAATCGCSNPIAIDNLDNKVAVRTSTGIIYMSCDGTTWTCLTYNPDKMIMNDRSEKLVKYGSYYIGNKTVYSCDMCCSGLSRPPGLIWYSKSTGGVMTIGGGKVGSCRGDNTTDEDACGRTSMQGLEIAIYCQTTSKSDNIYWKYKSLATYCQCATSYLGLSGQLINPINVSVNPKLDTVYGVVRYGCSPLACSGNAAAYDYQYLGLIRYDLGTCCCRVCALTCWCYYDSAVDGRQACMVCGSAYWSIATSFSSLDIVALQGVVARACTCSCLDDWWFKHVVCFDTSCAMTTYCTICCEISACSVGSGWTTPANPRQFGNQLFMFNYNSTCNCTNHSGMIVHPLRGMLFCTYKTCGTIDVNCTPAHIPQYWEVTTFGCVGSIATCFNSPKFDTGDCFSMTPTMMIQGQAAVYLSSNKNSPTWTCCNSCISLPTYSSRGSVGWLESQQCVCSGFSEGGPGWPNRKIGIDFALCCTVGVAAVGGKVFTDYGALPACFDLTTCFQVPKLGDGYFVKT